MSKQSIPSVQTTVAAAREYANECMKRISTCGVGSETAEVTPGGRAARAAAKDEFVVATDQMGVFSRTPTPLIPVEDEVPPIFSSFDVCGG